MYMELIFEKVQEFSIRTQQILLSIIRLYYLIFELLL